MHALALIGQHHNLVFPVTGAPKPIKRPDKGGVGHALCKPRAVVDQAQGSKWLDQGQLSPIKLTQAFIAFQQTRESKGLVGPLTAQEHPQVLHRRPHAGVVEIHKMWPPWRVGSTGGPQNIAWMKVAMQPQVLDAFGHGLLHLMKRRLAHLCPFIAALAGQAEILQQPPPGLPPKTLTVQRGSGRKGCPLAHLVYPRQESPKPSQHVWIVKFWPTPASLGAQTHVKSFCARHTRLIL